MVESLNAYQTCISYPKMAYLAKNVMSRVKITLYWYKTAQILHRITPTKIMIKASYLLV